MPDSRDSEGAFSLSLSRDSHPARTARTDSLVLQVLAILALAVLGFVSAMPRDQFELFVRKYNKVYASEAEYEARFQIVSSPFRHTLIRLTLHSSLRPLTALKS